jgi:hypothetical protein
VCLALRSPRAPSCLPSLDGIRCVGGARCWEGWKKWCCKRRRRRRGAGGVGLKIEKGEIEEFMFYVLVDIYQKRGEGS